MCLLVTYPCKQAPVSMHNYDLSAYACNFMCQFFVEFLGNKGKTCTTMNFRCILGNELLTTYRLVRKLDLSQ